MDNTSIHHPEQGRIVLGFDCLFIVLEMETAG